MEKEIKKEIAILCLLAFLAGIGVGLVSCAYFLNPSLFN